MQAEARKGRCRGPLATRTRALAATAVLAFAACTGSAKTSGRAPSGASSAPSPARSSGELAQRHPDDLRSSSQPALDVNALAPRLVATPSAPSSAPAAAESKAESNGAPAPIRLDVGSARPYPLQDDKLVLASGLIVHRVPKGVVVRAGREQETNDPVWEILDRRGRRIALLKERSFRRASVASAPVLEATTTMQRRVQRDAWSRGPVQVIVERFHGEHSIYTLERLASGTDWIAGGLELRTPDR